MPFVWLQSVERSLWRISPLSTSTFKRSYLTYSFLVVWQNWWSKEAWVEDDLPGGIYQFWALLAGEVTCLFSLLESLKIYRMIGPLNMRILRQDGATSCTWGGTGQETLQQSGTGCLKVKNKLNHKTVNDSILSLKMRQIEGE